MTYSLRVTLSPDFTLCVATESGQSLPLRSGFAERVLIEMLRRASAQRTPKFGTLANPTSALLEHFQFHQTPKNCAFCKEAKPTLRSKSMLDATESTIDEMLI